MSDNTEYREGPADLEIPEAGDKRPCLVMIKGDFIGQVYELKMTLLSLTAVTMWTSWFPISVSAADTR